LKNQLLSKNHEVIYWLLWSYVVEGRGNISVHLIVRSDNFLLLGGEIVK